MTNELKMQTVHLVIKNPDANGKETFENLLFILDSQPRFVRRSVIVGESYYAEYEIKEEA